MSLFSLAMAYLLNRKGIAGMAILSVGLGVGLLVLALSLRGELEASLRTSGAKADLVVGAGGADLTLVMASLFLADQPKANVSLDVYERALRQPGVISALPICLGDNVGSAPVVGVSREFFQETGVLALQESIDGRLFERDFEIVAGASAAKTLALTVGADVVTSHGGATAKHADFPFRVVGVLPATQSLWDRALFVPFSSYWRVHGMIASNLGGNRPQFSALLLRVQKAKLFQVKQQLESLFERENVSVVWPTQVLQRLFENVLTPLERVLVFHGGVTVSVAVCFVATALFLQTQLCRRDLALLRAIGAERREVLAIVLWQAVIVVVLGAGLGMAIRAGMLAVTRKFVAQQYGLILTESSLGADEALGLLAVLLVGVLTALAPAWLAYRVDPLTHLRK